MTTRIERGKPASIDQTFSLDGVATDADGPVTVTITRGDGTVLAAAAPTTKPAGTTGVYRYSLPAQAALDHLTLLYAGTWSGHDVTETQHVEIVGEFYFTVMAAREFDPVLTNYSAATIVAARTEVESTVERVTRVAWVPRYGRVTLNGSGTAGVSLPGFPLRRVLDGAVNGTALTTAELAGLVVEQDGAVTRPSGLFAAGRANVTIGYEYGTDSPPPDVRRAALLLVSQRLRVAVDPATANLKTLSVEGYSRTFAEPTGRADTGHAEVDRLLAPYVFDRSTAMSVTIR